MARWSEARGIAHTVRAGLSGPASPVIPTVLIAGMYAAVAGGAIALHLAAVGEVVGSAALSVFVAALVVIAYLRWPKPALFAFALFMLFVDTVRRYAGYSATYVDDLAVPLLLVVAAWRLRPWATGRLNLVREAAVAAVVGLAVASSLAQGVPLGTWLPGLLMVTKVFAFFYVAAWHDYDTADIRKFAALVMAIGVVVIGLGYIEALDPPAFRQALGLTYTATPRGELPSVRSLFFHPVLYGWFAAFIGLYLFAAYAIYRRWWLLVGALLFSAGVFLSARRRAIGGLVVGLLAGLLAQIGHHARWPQVVRAWLPIGAGMLALTLLFAPGIAELIALTGRNYGEPVVVDPADPVDPTDPAGEDSPLAGAARLMLYRGSVDVAGDHFPLGAGLGRYGSWMSRLEYSPLYHQLGFDQVWGLSPEYPNYITDTFWPQILGEIGLLGLAAYLLFVAVVALELWRAARAFREPLLLAFCLGTLMVFGQALVETLASSMFHSPPRIYLILGAVGMALALLRGRRTANETASPTSPNRGTS